MKDLKVFFKDGEIHLFTQVFDFYCIESDLFIKHENAVGSIIISYYPLKSIYLFYSC